MVCELYFNKTCEKKKTIEKLELYHLSCFPSRGPSLFGVSIPCALHQPAKVLIFKFLYVCISHTYTWHVNTYINTHLHQHTHTDMQRQSHRLTHTDIRTHTYTPTCSLVKGTTLLSGWGNNEGLIQVSTQITVLISFSVSGNSGCGEKRRMQGITLNFIFTTHVGLWSLFSSLKAFDCVDHNKLWKILKEMGMPDHLTSFLRNLYAGQKPTTVRTGHGTTDWFQIGKRLRQDCILSPSFNLYAEYILRNTGLDETQAGIKISRRNINNLRYADDSTLMKVKKN